MPTMHFDRTVSRMIHSAFLTALSAPVNPSFPPLVPGNTMRDESADTRDPHQPRGERILLVDDEAVLRRLASTILLRQGYVVIEASGPTEALARGAAEPDSFDLILADVMMPGMRGWEMVDRLRVSQPRARVLYMSGYVGELDGDAIEKVRPLLSKPFRPRDLIEEVRRVLSAG
jgi:two-component system cell cycle sensor histidine kinase/response regulator CckA